MKFALFTHVPWPDGVEPAQLLRETIEQVEYGEALGFYSAWIAEHHFSRYSMGSSSLVLASHIAAKTQLHSPGDCRAAADPAQSHSAGRGHRHDGCGQRRTAGRWIWPWGR